MEKQINFFTEDWKKIPQNLRFLIIAGMLLVFNTWLLDHWGKESVYLFWGLEIRAFGYSLGTTLVFFAFGLLVAKQLLFFYKIVRFRKKYPINKLDESYYLVWFNGKLILFDRKEKKYYHVFPLETAQDLMFVSRGFGVSTDFVASSLKEFPVNVSGKRIRMKEYENGGSINTSE